MPQRVIQQKQQVSKRDNAALHGDQRDLCQWMKKDVKKSKIQWKDINRYFCSGEQDDVVSTGTFTLRRRDYKSLVGRNYVNDLVIEEYLEIIKETIKQSIWTLEFSKSSFETAYSNTESWNKDDLCQCDIILYPIHRNDHWCLISIDSKVRLVEYYDSIIGSRRTSRAPMFIKCFIEEQAQR